jgi:hypothetical protein
MYSSGDGTPLDFAQAAAWFEKAAEQGHSAAQLNLGILLYQGQGIAKDAVKAAALFRQAADRGTADAQFYLGVMYFHGDGVAQDVIQAYAWLDRAASSGHQDAVKFRASLESVLTSGQLAEARRVAGEWKPATRPATTDAGR